jgi:hypothetical protein
VKGIRYQNRRVVAPPDKSLSQRQSKGRQRCRQGNPLTDFKAGRMSIFAGAGHLPTAPLKQAAESWANRILDNVA